MIYSVVAENTQRAVVEALDGVIGTGEWVGEKREVTNYTVDIQYPTNREPDLHSTIVGMLDDFHGDNHYHETTNWTFPTNEVGSGLTGEPTPNDETGEYFDRLCFSPKGNQLVSMVEKIEKWERNNRTVAQVFQVSDDLNAMFPPCLLSLQVLARNGEINLTAYFRSHTVAKSYYGDITALGRLMDWLAEQTDLLVGTLTVISGSLHIRKKNNENELASEMRSRLLEQR